jgi:hypothetical protein
MIRVGVSLLMVSILAASAVGCVVTEERLTAGTGFRVHDEAEEPLETAYRRSTERHPDDPHGWWRLGDYYESNRFFPQAIEAYLQFRALVLDPAMNEGRPATAGDLHVGRALAKARIYAESVPYLRAVLALQPPEDRLASLDRNFREAHYWRDLLREPAVGALARALRGLPAPRRGAPPRRPVAPADRGRDEPCRRTGVRGAGSGRARTGPEVTRLPPGTCRNAPRRRSMLG